MALAEVRDGAKIRRIESDNAHEVDPLARRLGDPARRVDAIAIGIKQQRRHHRRAKRRLSALARVSRSDLTKLEMLEHKRQNKAGQVVLADKVLHARRQQQRLIDRPPAAVLLMSKQNPTSAHTHRHQFPLFPSDKASLGGLFFRVGGATRQNNWSRSPRRRGTRRSRTPTRSFRRWRSPRPCSSRRRWRQRRQQ